MPATPAQLDAAKKLTYRAPKLPKLAAFAALRDASAVPDADLTAVRQEVRHFARQEEEHLRDLREAIQSLQDRQSATAAEASTLALVKAAAASFDSTLKKPTTIDARLTQARESLSRYRIDARLQQTDTLLFTQQGDRLLATLSPAFKAELPRLLGEFIQGWGRAARDQIAQDLQMELYDHARTLDAPLPISVRGQPPADLSLPDPFTDPGRWWDQHDLPDLQSSGPLPGFWAELYRQLRTQLFAVLSIVGIVGLSGEDRKYVWLAALPVLLPVLYTLVAREQQQKRQEIEDRLEKEIRTSLLAWVEHRLKRSELRLKESFTGALRVQIRDRWQAWFQQGPLARIRALEAEKTAMERESREKGEALLTRERAYPKAEVQAFLNS